MIKDKYLDIYSLITIVNLHFHIRYAKRVNFWMKRYENFVGLTEVKAAQGTVVQMEKAFVETQDLRRELQMKVR